MSSFLKSVDHIPGKRDHDDRHMSSFGAEVEMGIIPLVSGSHADHLLFQKADEPVRTGRESYTVIRVSTTGLS